MKNISKSLRILLSATILSLMVVAIPASPAQAQREITLVPDEGNVGSTITVAGIGFNKSTGTTDKYAIIYFSSQEASTVDDIDSDITIYEVVRDGVWLDENGEFEVTFTVPDELNNDDADEEVTSGTYYVYVCHYLSTTPPTVAPRIRAVAEFTITSGEITIDPDEGSVAAEMEIIGADFSSDKDITIEYDGDDIDIADGDDETDSDGEFVSYILIPESTAGAHTITVTVAGNEAEAEFTIEPEIIISPTSGEVETSVTVSGTGFGRRKDVVIYFSNAGIATAIADSRGGFDTTFSVPESEEGIYDVEAEDEDRNLDSAKFTITAPPPAPSPAPPPPPPTAINISSTSGKVGTDVIISGVGFEPNGTIAIKYDGKEVTTATADVNGIFMAIFKVPASESGEHTITISNGTNTEELSFTVESEPPPIPSPLLPEMGVEVKLPITFDWKSVTADNPPVTYTLQIATDSEFLADSIVLEKEGLTKSEYTVTEAEAHELVGRETAYYWRVRAVDDAANEGDWTGAGKFYVAAPFAIPRWAIYTLIGLADLLLFAFGYWMGRRAAYHY